MKRSQSQKLHELITNVRERNGKPVNVYVVYATIESFGVREVDVKEDYGFNSIEHLSRYIFNKLDIAELADLKNERQKVADAELNDVVYLSSYHIVRKKLFVNAWTSPEKRRTVPLQRGLIS